MYWILLFVFTTTLSNPVTSSESITSISSIADENVSTYGLPSCYCNACDPTRTVGKIYNNVCYFLTLNESFKIVARQANKTRPVMNDYRPAIVKSLALTKIFSQVSNEMKLKHFEGQFLKVVFFLEKPANITMLLPSTSDNISKFEDQTSCLKLVLSEDKRHMGRDCKREHIVFLTATNFISLPPFEVPSPKACSFETNAVAYVSKNQCLKVKEMNEDCAYTYITDRLEFQAVHNYLMNLTQEQSLNITVGKYLRFHGIDQGVVSTNHMYSIYKDGRSGNNCIFFDVERKQIVFDQCERSHKNLCTISNNIIPGKTDLELDDNVLNTSTYGLRNCYCKTCNQTLTVGKMFRKTCYFITLQEKYKIVSRLANMEKRVNGTYMPAVLDSDRKAKVFEQIVNELRLRNHLQNFHVGFFIDKPIDSSMLVRSTLIVPVPKKCFKMKLNNRTKSLHKDCTNSYPILLMTNKTNSFSKLSLYTKPPFETCEFDNTAMWINETNQCVKARSGNDCSRVRINSSAMLESIHAYLMNLSQDNAYKMQIWNQVYRIDTYLSDTLFNNSLYSIFVHPKRKNDCLFIDVLGKQIVYNGCNYPHRNLCVVENSLPNVTEPASENINTTLNVIVSRTNVTSYPKEIEHSRPKIRLSFLLVGLGVMTMISMITVYMYIRFIKKR